MTAPVGGLLALVVCDEVARRVASGAGGADGTLPAEPAQALATYPKLARLGATEAPAATNTGGAVTPAEVIAWARAHWGDPEAQAPSGEGHRSSDDEDSRAPSAPELLAYALGALIGQAAREAADEALAGVPEGARGEALRTLEVAALRATATGGGRSIAGETAAEAEEAAHALWMRAMIAMHTIMPQGKNEVRNETRRRFKAVKKLVQQHAAPAERDDLVAFLERLFTLQTQRECEDVLAWLDRVPGAMASFRVQAYGYARALAGSDGAADASGATAGETGAAEGARRVVERAVERALALLAEAGLAWSAPSAEGPAKATRELAAV